MSENKTMMWIVGILLLLIVAAGAYWYWSTNIDTPTEDETTDDETVLTDETGDSLSVVLTEQNGSGQSGTMVLQEVNGQLVATINLTSPTSQAEPAHIHNGSCPTPGGVVYPLSDVVNGVSVTTLDTTLAELEGLGELAVNVHKSAEESSVYYSCGDLLF